MRIHVDSSQRGAEMSATVTVRGTEAELIDLIDSMDSADGSARTLGQHLARGTGLVESPSNMQNFEIANALRHFADLLDS